MLNVHNELIFAPLAKNCAVIGGGAISGYYRLPRESVSHSGEPRFQHALTHHTADIFHDHFGIGIGSELLIPCILFEFPNSISSSEMFQTFDLLLCVMVYI